MGGITGGITPLCFPPGSCSKNTGIFINHAVEKTNEQPISHSYQFKSKVLFLYNGNNGYNMYKNATYKQAAKDIRRDITTATTLQ